MLRRPRQRELTLILALLAIAALVRLPGVFSRSIWYDEAISLVTSAGQAQPRWPASPVAAAEARASFFGRVSFAQMVEEVRRFDVHPPLYYWLLGLWRSSVGSSLESARIFSLICSLGAILTLYLLLRAAQVPGPWLMALVYALSTGAAHSGHEARAYALASWLLLGAAWLGWRARLAAADAGPQAAATYALTAAVACGLAFHVNYLTLFPTATLLAWLSVVSWRRSRWLALVAPLVALLIVGLGGETLLEQLDSRPNQLTGFAGLGSELSMLLRVNAQMVGIPLAADGHSIRYLAAIGLFLFLLGLTAVQVVRHRQEVDRAFWLLIAGLAAAPSAGVLLLDLAFDKRLHVSRYVNFAGPAMAILVSYGLVMIGRSQRRALGNLSLACLMAIQASNLNWGQELCPNSEFGSLSRTLAQLIRSTSSPHHVVVVAKGNNHSGNVGPLVYELDPGHTIICFGRGSDVDELIAKIAPFDDVWLVDSVDKGTRAIEQELLERLKASRRYRGILRYGRASHLAKVGSTRGT